MNIQASRHNTKDHHAIWYSGFGRVGYISNFDIFMKNKEALLASTADDIREHSLVGYGSAIFAKKIP